MPPSGRPTTTIAFRPSRRASCRICDVEVWLLSQSAAVAASGETRRDVVQIGKHGLQIARGENRGLLLPGVAVDDGFNAEQFLEHVCLKAELPPTAWRKTTRSLWTFEGHSIRSPLSELLDSRDLPTPTSAIAGRPPSSCRLWPTIAA